MIITIEEKNLKNVLIVVFVALILLSGVAYSIGHGVGMRYMYYHHENFTDKECSCPDQRFTMPPISSPLAVPNFSEVKLEHQS